MARCDLARLTEGERAYVEWLHGERLIARLKQPFVDALLRAREVKIDRLVQEKVT